MSQETGAYALSARSGEKQANGGWGRAVAIWAPGILGGTNVASPVPAFSSSTRASDGHHVPLVSRESSAGRGLQGAMVASQGLSFSASVSLGLSL